MMALKTRKITEIKNYWTDKYNPELIRLPSLQNSTSLIVEWEIQNDQENAWWMDSCGSSKEVP